MSSYLFFNQKGDTMLTREQLALEVACIIGAIRDVEKLGLPGVPESMIYVALDMDMEKYMVVMHALERGEFIERKFGVIGLSQDGRELADRVNEEVDKRKAEAEKGETPE